MYTTNQYTLLFIMVYTLLATSLGGQADMHVHKDFWVEKFVDRFIIDFFDMNIKIFSINANYLTLVKYGIRKIASLEKA